MRGLSVFVLVGGVLVAAGSSQATFTTQDVRLSLGFSGSAFEAASLSTVHRIGSRGRAAGDSDFLSWFSPSTAQDISVTPISNVQIQNVSTVPQPPSIVTSYTLRYSNTADAVHEFSSRITPVNERLLVGNDGQFATLRFLYPASPLSVLTAQPTFRLEIPGDWSSRGVGSGQLELLTRAETWTVTSDFVFDGRKTVFAAQRASGLTGVNLSFVLRGEVIPGPGGAALAGLAGVVLARRRRR